MESNKYTILDMAEIWPETDATVRLLLVNAEGEYPFAVWAETGPENSIFLFPRYFPTESDARSAYKLIMDVLVELRNPDIDLFDKAHFTRNQ